jgi:ABC-type transport system involved in cytochrome bd biosynthesis fused ATPase/permease subunit
VDRLDQVYAHLIIGKTSLMLSLLGELQRVNGTNLLPDPRVSAMDKPDRETGLVKNCVSYVAQSAWLLNATVRENILFGRPFDADRYWKVIDACALKRDLETLDAGKFLCLIEGDMTEIGEKGVNVSGGQKQRISLARAAYSPSSIVLLDDPLSAVDAPTARHLLLKCILGPLMEGRTVILVSHAVGLVLPRADYVVVVKNGTISAQGTPYDLVQGTSLTGIVSDEVLARGPDAFMEELEGSRIDESRDSIASTAQNSNIEVTLESSKSEDKRKDTGKIILLSCR